MTADRFLAVPYVEKGRSYDGFDCFGLAWLYHLDVLGIRMADWAHVSPRAFRTVSQIIGEEKRAWPRPAEPIDGDVAVMRCFTRRSIIPDLHIGIVENRRFVLHTDSQAGTRLERLSAPHVAARIMDFRRHPSRCA